MPRPWGLSLSSFSRLVWPFVSRRSALGGYARLRHWLKERRLAKKLHLARMRLQLRLRLSYLTLLGAVLSLLSRFCYDEGSQRSKHGSAKGKEAQNRGLGVFRSMGEHALSRENRLLRLTRRTLRVVSHVIARHADRRQGF